jgi:hypothetical protein
MIIAVQGTDSFDDYNVFMRSMAVGMSMLSEDDKNIIVYSVGPRRINSFVSEFCNVTERSLKARGIRIRFQKVPIKWAESNLNTFDYLIFLSKPKEYQTKLVDKAEAKDIEVGIFRY